MQNLICLLFFASGTPACVSRVPRLTPLVIRAANQAAIIGRNEQSVDKQSAGEVDVSDDEVISDNYLEPDLNKGEEPVIGKDEFSKLRNLSPEDFKVALNFLSIVQQRQDMLPPLGLTLFQRSPNLPLQNLLPSIVMLPFSRLWMKPLEKKSLIKRFQVASGS